MEKENVACVHTMEYYSGIKEDKLQSPVGKWMHLETVLSEINQAHKLKYCIVSLI